MSSLEAVTCRSEAVRTISTQEEGAPSCLGGNHCLGRAGGPQGNSGVLMAQPQVQVATGEDEDSPMILLLHSLWLGWGVLFLTSTLTEAGQLSAESRRPPSPLD